MSPRPDVSTPTFAANDDALMKRARQRVAMKMGFLTHLAVFTIVNLGLWLHAIQAGSPNASRWTLFGWGLGLAIHGLVTALRLYGERVGQQLLKAEVARLRQRD